MSILVVSFVIFCAVVFFGLVAWQRSKGPRKGPEIDSGYPEPRTQFDPGARVDRSPAGPPGTPRPRQSGEDRVA